MSELSFNQIAVNSGQRSGSLFSPDEFIGLPVTDRVKMVLGKQISFLMNNQEVDKSQSLNELRQLSAAL